MELEPAQCQIHLWFDPQMRLWEKEESRLHLRLMNRQEGTDITHPVPVTIHDLQEGEKAWDDPDAYRVYHVRRFFDTMEGFYTGELDLTGRHQLRFDDLLSLHAKFMWDMTRVREIAHKIKYKVKKRDGTTEIVVCYEITDQDIYDDFRLRWKIPRVVGFSWLEDRIARLAQTIHSSQGTPKIQRLCLSDLPTEIIDYIFSYTTPRQSRSLAATSKQMKAMGARHVPYNSRTLKLELSSKDFDNAEGMDECEKATFYVKLASEMRHKLILVTDFLLSRPDLTDALRSLRFEDEWKFRIFMQSFPSALDNLFYSSIHSCLNQVLCVCKNLTNLTISHLGLNTDWLTTLSRLARLRSIRFYFVSIQDPTLADMILSTRVPPCNQVSALEVVKAGDEDSLWRLLLLFPSLNTLDYMAIRLLSTFPDQVIQERSRALFSTLQRLALSKVDSWQVPSLIRWINSRPSHICTLTHVKLEMVWGLSDDVAIDFVESLDSAPLQVLVLEGIETGSITLIDRIAQIFPDLLGLTLVRRGSNRQIKTKMCRWPRPCWEYAARLGSFRRLEYFGWNFAVGISDCLTPAALLLLEKIVQGMDPDEAEEEVWRFIHEDCLRKDEEIVAVVRPFAVQCPSLETIAFESGPTATYCLISRVDGGGIKLELGYPVMRDWNPMTSYGFGWNAGNCMTW